MSHMLLSMLNTRFNRCAQIIDARRSVAVGGSSASMALLPLPRFAGVTNARCRLLGANIKLADPLIITELS